MTADDVACLRAALIASSWSMPKACAALGLDTAATRTALAFAPGGMTLLALHAKRRKKPGKTREDHIKVDVRIPRDAYARMVAAAAAADISFGAWARDVLSGALHD